MPALKDYLLSHSYSTEKFALIINIYEDNISLM
jgi:hypothetical protein